MCKSNVYILNPWDLKSFDSILLGRITKCLSLFTVTVVSLNYACDNTKRMKYNQALNRPFKSHKVLQN